MVELLPRLELPQLQCGRSQYVNSGPTNPGRWSYAQSSDTIWVDSSYWNNNDGGC
nr:hypothetical protein [Actinokineospora sp. NBRC 105648]